MVLIRVLLEVYNVVIGIYKNLVMVFGEVVFVVGIVFYVMNGLCIIVVDFWLKGVKYQCQLFWGVLLVWGIIMVGFVFCYLMFVFVGFGGGY